MSTRSPPPVIWSPPAIVEVADVPEMPMVPVAVKKGISKVVPTRRFESEMFPEKVEVASAVEVMAPVSVSVVSVVAPASKVEAPMSMLPKADEMAPLDKVPTVVKEEVTTPSPSVVPVKTVTSETE